MEFVAQSAKGTSGESSHLLLKMKIFKEIESKEVESGLFLRKTFLGIAKEVIFRRV